ncbi:cobalamin-dependent protein [Clostridia bacterium]|nr:cobalamin-dependent protein [Clostridia bacterium]
MEVLEKIAQVIYEGDTEKTIEYAKQAVAEGLDPNVIINDGGVKGLDKLGEDFDNLEVFLPELMLGAESMKALIAEMAPLLEAQGESAYKGTVVIGCAKGDLHDIGMNLVATQLAINGFKIFNMGTDVGVGEYIDKAKEVDANIIAVSSLMTTSAYYQEELVSRLSVEGLRDKYKVVVGGGPITPTWTKKIGADGYSRTSNLAVDLCIDLVGTDANTQQEPLIYE